MYDDARPNRINEAAEAIKKAGAAIVCTQEENTRHAAGTAGLYRVIPELGDGRQGGNEDEHCAIFYHRGLLKSVERSRELRSIGIS